MSIKVKNIVLVVLLLGLISMTVAYAALTQRLDIESTAGINSLEWDVHFANLSKGEVIGSPSITEPKLSNITINGLDVEFTKPGESVTYNFDIVNNGTIDARLDTLKINTKEDGIVCTDSNGSKDSQDAINVCNNISFSVTKANGLQFNEGDILSSKDTINAKLVVSYNGDLESLPTTRVTVKGLNAVFEYIQD